MIYTRAFWGGTLLMGLVLFGIGLGLLVGWSCPAHAETRLNLGVGVTKFLVTTQDGTWWQQPFEHRFATPLRSAIKTSFTVRANDPVTTGR